MPASVSGCASGDASAGAFDARFGNVTERRTGNFDFVAGGLTGSLRLIGCCRCYGFGNEVEELICVVCCYDDYGVGNEND